MIVVHIAGTNGKGSVSEYMYRILTAAGLKTGCFTSPHLVSPVERFRLGGRTIEEETFGALMEEVAQKRLAVNDTLFAAYTAAALLWFEREGAQAAVIETGIGGRYDSTNVIATNVSILTPIGFDHMAVLGDTLEKIAYDKSGIIKRGVPVISAVQPKEAMAVIRSESLKMGAPLFTAPPVRILSESVTGQTFELEGCRYDIRAIGRHQPDNAALAAKAAQVLGIGREAVSQGLKNAALKCRAQYVPGKPDILLDGAHNFDAAAALCGVLDGYFPHRDKILLFACMKDKDYLPMIRLLAPRFVEVTVTGLPMERAEDPSRLRAHFAAYTRCAVRENAADAFEQAKDAAKKSGAMLVVCGSFYLAGLIEPLTAE